MKNIKRQKMIKNKNLCTYFHVIHGKCSSIYLINFVLVPIQESQEES